MIEASGIASEFEYSPGERLLTAESFGLEFLSDHFVSEWARLVERSLEANVFYAPKFVLAAIRHLGVSGKLFVTAVRDDAGTLVALGLFEQCPASRRVPFPHLQAFQTIHSFRSGLLVDADRPAATVRALLRHLNEQGHWAIEFCEQWLDSPIARELRSECGVTKYHWWESNTYWRPAFRQPVSTVAGAAAHWSKSRRKSVKKASRRLEELGQWDLRVVDSSGDFAGAIERFLALEHAGWKSEAGSSLLSNDAEASFFREMATALGESNGAFFLELVSDGRTIGSTANLKSQQTAFAFKVGWDPQFADVSPGMLLDAFLLTESTRLLPDVQLVDSCAKGDSYLGNLWPQKLRMGNAVLTLKRRSRYVASALNQGRYAKRALFSRPTSLD